MVAAIPACHCMTLVRYAFAFRYPVTFCFLPHFCARRCVTYVNTNTFYLHSRYFFCHSGRCSLRCRALPHSTTISTESSGILPVITSASYIRSSFLTPVIYIRFRFARLFTREPQYHSNRLPQPRFVCTFVTFINVVHLFCSLRSRLRCCARVNALRARLRILVFRVV